MALLYRTGADAPVTIRPAKAGRFALQELQQYVGGMVEITRLENGACVILDREAEEKGKPHNPHAEQMIRTGAYGITPDTPVMGDVIFASPQELGDYAPAHIGAAIAHRSSELVSFENADPDEFDRSVCRETNNYLVMAAQGIKMAMTDAKNAVSEDTVTGLMEAALGHELRCRADHGQQIDNAKIEWLKDQLIGLVKEMALHPNSENVHSWAVRVSQPDPEEEDRAKERAI